MYKRQPQKLSTSKVDSYVDSDHAGCLATRRSTTGLVARLGQHVVKTASNLQSTTSLSSGESEYYGVVKGCAMALSLQALLVDWGVRVQARVFTDSAAARGTISRRGLGRLRHVQTRYLWVQERCAAGDVAIEKVGTKDNFADILTKPCPAETIDKHMATCHQVFEEGRSDRAKRVMGTSCWLGLSELVTR